MAFDWASQPFYTLCLTFVFGPYFTQAVATSLGAGGLDPQAAAARSQEIWSWGQTGIGLAIALTAPVLGAMADRSGRRMGWVWAFSVFYVCGTAGMWSMAPDASNTVLALGAFAVAMVGAEYATIFTNAMLPGLAPRAAIGRVSGSGYALGYAGGVLALAIFLLLFADDQTGRTLLGRAPALGLDGGAREGTRAVGPFAAIWYVVFMVPFFVWVREPRVAGRPVSVRGAAGDVAALLRAVPRRPSLFAWLAGSMLYRDALAALYAFGGVYAVLVLGWATTQIGIFGILAAIAAAGASWAGGRLDARVGPKPVIVACVLILTGVVVTLCAMSREAIFGVPLPPRQPGARRRALRPGRRDRRRRGRAAGGVPHDDGAPRRPGPRDGGLRPLRAVGQGDRLPRARLHRHRDGRDGIGAAGDISRGDPVPPRPDPATLGGPRRRPPMIRPAIPILCLLLAACAGPAAPPPPAATARVALAPDTRLAKSAFGAQPAPSAQAATPLGSYAKGCAAGNVALPETGPTWQAMRLSRNRNWGHPQLVDFVQDLSRDAARNGWAGLYVGDLSQPRGGPMLTGHRSHQIGLDADIWLYPTTRMDLSRGERESLSAISMQRASGAFVNDRWTPRHMALVRAAAEDPRTARIFIFPGAKVAMCDAATGDRSWLRKVRPWYGHHYHMHVRLACPRGAAGCEDQTPPPPGDGCDDARQWQRNILNPPPPAPRDPNAPAPQPRRELTVADLPQQCSAVLQSR